MNLFSHINLSAELERISQLSLENFYIAYHSDADGCLAAAFMALIFRQKIDGYYFVKSEDLDLERLCRWIVQESVVNLMTLDINVFSHEGSLEKMAKLVFGQVQVIDDHLGAQRSFPTNVSFVDLLPPGLRKQRKDQIRPSFLFADALAGLALGNRNEMHRFLVLAGLHGEGVVHLFRFPDLQVGERVYSQSRNFGRGLTAYFIANNPKPEDDKVIKQLIDLLSSGPAQESIENAAIRATESELGKELLLCSHLVSEMVSNEAMRVLTDKPWLTTNSYDVFKIDVNSDKRIVNLVASEARAILGSGITIAVQNTQNGFALELRRARDLDAPDLASMLFCIDGDKFISRGGHPMACGATVKKDDIDDVLLILRDQLSRAGN